MARIASNKALQLTWHSAFQSRSGSLLASTLGASATVGGLCHAAERPIRWAAKRTTRMPVLMPTVRLWKQLGAPHPLAPVAPTADSILGDWSLKSIDNSHGRFIVGVNERTLMAVVFAERPMSRLASTLSTCVGAQLEVFGIPQDRIAAEVSALRSAGFGKNRGRSLLGIVNEVAFQFEVAAADSEIARSADLLEIQTELNGIPHRASSPSCVFADDAIVGLLGAQTFH